MSRCRSAFGLATAVLLLWMAVPTQAQRIADLSSAPPPALTSAGVADDEARRLRSPAAVLGREVVSVRAPTEALAATSAQAKPWSRTRATLTGALAGAALGTLAFLVQADRDNCATPESMCGLAAPVFVGGGALVGGTLGFVIRISTD